MKEIIKIENLLNTNKAILEAQISINTNVHKLYISGEYWNSTLFSDFKSAILTIDTNKNVDYLKQLKNLSVEVLELYSKLERLPHDYKTIGGDTQMVLITREFDTPDIAIYKDYYNGEKWIWQMIMNNKHKVISKIVTDPNQYDKALHIKNDIILSDTKQIINILSLIQPQPESTFLITTVERSRMIEIHKYLSEKKYIDVDVDSWLYWFSKHTWTNQKKKPSTIKWLEAAYHLTNVVYLICGNMEVQTESAMKKAFKLPTGSKFQKLTTKNINGDFYNNIKNMINWAERFAIK